MSCHVKVCKDTHCKGYFAAVEQKVMIRKVSPGQVRFICGLRGLKCKTTMKKNWFIYRNMFPSYNDSAVYDLLIV